jgi:cysteinyl-tRNA synthetase
MRGYAFNVLGLQLETTIESGEGAESGALLDLLVELRGTAKANKDWSTADSIRDVLKSMGISIKDSKEGSTWERD